MMKNLPLIELTSCKAAKNVHDTVQGVDIAVAIALISIAIVVVAAVCRSEGDFGKLPLDLCLHQA